MDSKVAWKLKMINRVILKRRLILNQKERTDVISETDIINLNIALKTSETFDELFELIELM